MLLDQADRNSATWAKLKRHFEERLQDHRIKNDGNLTEIDTAKLRGRIAEIVYALDLATPTPAKKPE